MENRMGFSELASQFIIGTSFSDIPQDVAELARLGIADFIGVALAGTKEDLYEILLRYVQKMGGEPQVTIIGSGVKTSPYHAALVNGAVGHALDFDDWSMAIYGHPSVFLAPAILALGESIGASGSDVLTAYVVGYEICACIPWIVKKNHYDRGWHITGTIGSLGAAAAASWLLKLNDSQVKTAIGIAASLAGGIRANNGTMTKPLHAGQAAANGIQAALLAQDGYTAIQNIFAAQRGFVESFGYNDEVNWPEAMKDLGKTFALTSPEGLIIKPYPSCGGTHFAIDAVFDLKENYNFAVDNITEIELWVNPVAELPLIYHNPKTGLEGKFSLEYTVARALLSGHVNLNDFTDELVNHPEVKKLIGKMKWLVKYPMPGKGSSTEFDPKGIIIKLKNGQVIAKEVFISKGMRQNPLTPEEFNLKFIDCVSPILPNDKLERSLEILNNLKNIGNIEELMRCLKGDILN